MTLGRTTIAGLAVTIGLAAGQVFAQARAAVETFSATASVKSAAGAAATAPVTIEVTRVTPADEAEKLVSAFKTGGAAALSGHGFVVVVAGEAHRGLADGYADPERRARRAVQAGQRGQR